MVAYVELSSMVYAPATSVGFSLMVDVLVAYVVLASMAYVPVAFFVYLSLLVFYTKWDLAASET